VKNNISLATAHLSGTLERARQLLSRNEGLDSEADNSHVHLWLRRLIAAAADCVSMAMEVVKKAQSAELEQACNRFDERGSAVNHFSVLVDDENVRASECYTGKVS